MQDRVPVNPGRVKITPEGGSAYYATMVRADNPTQEGTPINKASLLKDTTAALYGLGTDAVPDDVLIKLDNSRLKIGDILTTTRTNLGGDWLLCNGDVISASEYPELFNILSSAGLEGDWTNVLASSLINTPGAIYSTLFANGYYIIAAYDSSNSSYRIHYTTDFLGPWSTCEITGGWSNDIGKIKYINGYYILTHGRYIHYATTPGGPWTLKEVGNSSYNSTVFKDIIYADGYYVACGRWGSSYNKVIAYATTIDGTWTCTYDGFGTRGSLVAIAHGNGYYVALSPSTSTDSKGIEILYTTNPSTGVWTLVTIRAYSTSYNDVGAIIYENGKFIIAGEENIFLAINPTSASNWSSAHQFDVQTRIICYKNGNYLMAGGSGSTVQLWYTTDLEGAWTQIPVSSEFKTLSGLSFMASDNTYCLSNNICVDYIILGELPTITSDKSYSYIKALEG